MPLREELISIETMATASGGSSRGGRGLMQMLSTRSEGGFPEVARLSFANDEQGLKRAIERGESIDVMDANGHSPLELALMTDTEDTAV